jgi:hypothetical protein
LAETIDHILVSCVFSRQFWLSLLGLDGIQEILPQPDDVSFLQWWTRSSAIVTGAARQGLNSVMGVWVLWKHRNRCIFDVAPPNLTSALAQPREEKLMWEMAGAKCMSTLAAPLLVD